MISEKFLEKLNKNEYYCYFCAEEGNANIINFHKDKNIIEPCEIHKYKKSNFYSIYFDFELNKWYKRRCNLNTKFELVTLEDDQFKELNNRYIYINIDNIPNDIKILDNEEGIFYISKLLNKDYISIHKNKYTYKKVNLIRKCKNDNKEFKITNISRIEESTCCSKECYKEYENKSRKDAIENGNKYISIKFLEKLDKNECYCYYCAKLNEINKLNFDEQNCQYIPCSKHKGSNYLMLGFLDKNKSWNIIHGVKKLYQNNKITTLEDKQKYILNNSFTNIKVNDLPDYVLYKDIDDSFNDYYKDNKDYKKLMNEFYISNLLNENYINTIENEFTNQKIYLYIKCMNPECNNILPVNYLKFNKTYLCIDCKDNFGNYLLTCEACGNNFVSKGTIHNNCKYCEEELNNFYKNEDNKIINTILYDKINKKLGNYKIIKEIEFKDKNNYYNNIKIIEYKHFYYIYQLCSGCKINYKLINYIPINKFNNKESKIYYNFDKFINYNKNCYCSDICRTNYNQNPGYCTNKDCNKWSEIRDSTGLCMECRNKISKENWNYKYCSICNYETPHNGSVCLICHPESRGGSNKYLIKKDNVRFWKSELAEDVANGLLNGTKSFDDYPELEDRKGYICYNKHDILTDDPIYFTSFLSEQDGIRFWKNERADILVEELLNGEKDINDYPQLEIRYKHYICYLRKDILTDEIVNYQSNSPLQIYNGIEFIHLVGVGDILKDEYFSTIAKNIENSNSNEEIEKLIIEEGFAKEPIIKIDNGKWSRKLTDEYLKSKGYGWICYIKLFKNHPFIVGKTGTSAVHDSTIDFDFIVGDDNDPNRTGFGRKFIREKYPEIKYTDFDYILCKNFESEKEALKFEEYISDKYNLFES